MTTGGYEAYAHLRQFGYLGYRCAPLENEAIRIVVAAGKGADIVEFQFKPVGAGRAGRGGVIGGTS